MDNVVNKNKNIVFNSRIRLSRNINDIPFPNKIDAKKGKEVVKMVEDVFYNDKNKEDFKTLYLWENNNLAKDIYLNKHLITPQLASNADKSAFICNNDETLSIMINEEDHIVIQSIVEGFELNKAFDKADIIDDFIEKKLDFSFNEDLGYLTACPTKLGTGLRASVMLHLPALVMTNEIVQVLNAVAHLGMTISAVYNDGSKAQGNIFYISNQITLGISESEILNNLIAVTNQIINQENIARERLCKKYKNELNDRIMRSLGILKYAVTLNNKECLKLLSNVRMGIELGIIKDIDLKTVNSLFIETQPAVLEKCVNMKLNGKQADLYRAEVVRKKL